jgi:hypothetical protein
MLPAALTEKPVSPDTRPKRNSRLGRQNPPMLEGWNRFLALKSERGLRLKLFLFRIKG